MATSLITNIKASLASPALIKRNGFSLLAKIAALVNESGEMPAVQDLVLRALAQRANFGPSAVILDALVRSEGLYPYLDPELLDFADRVSYELHRPENLDSIVFHRAQAKVYRRLLEGKNIALSAPTSFGKSLIIDAMVASRRFDNVAIVVPTIALIDETRRRLVEKFRDSYKVITHPTQRAERRNIYVLTQERAVNFLDIRPIDFLVVDEFYKLDPRQDDSRSFLLNQAFYKLYSPKTQFYLLGPSIESLSDSFCKKFNCSFYYTDYSTVASEVSQIKVASKAQRLPRLIEVCKSLQDPTLIYCSSPASARKVAQALLENSALPEIAALSDASAWVGHEYHPDWIFAKALRQGVGLHHGKIPRSLSQYVVRAFNSGLLRFLVCTSTLIEGVNTKAKNVVVFDHKIALKKLDYFTFNNIIGRSGRMFSHFIGRVFLFDEPPEKELPSVVIPLTEQGSDVPYSFLIQLKNSDLTAESRERLVKFTEQKDLSLSVIRANHGISPEAQMLLARELRRHPTRYHPNLKWKSIPSWDELRSACDLIWDFFIVSGRHGGVSSGKQLAFLINQFRRDPKIYSLIKARLGDKGKEPDDAVEDCLEFLRYWPEFHFPRFLMALSRIQEEVFLSLRLQPGNYGYFAVQVENHFGPAGLIALEEYGVPIQVGRKIERYLGGASDLDQTLAALRKIDPARLPLSGFERGLLDDTKSCI